MPKAALMPKVSPLPAVQTVPGATGWTADQVPEAQRCQDVPPMQFHAPSLVQGVPASLASTEEPLPEPVVAGVLAARRVETTRVVGAADVAPWLGIVLKTPLEGVGTM